MGGLKKKFYFGTILLSILVVLVFCNFTVGALDFFAINSASLTQATLSPSEPYSVFGYSVGSGDVNNDGYADVIVGAYRADLSTGTDSSGQVYVFFGTANGINDVSAYGNANLTFNGTTAGDRLGVSVGSGDVNNDSYADIIVGAYVADPSGATNAGQAYVFFGADYPNAVGISYNATEDANITFNGTTASDTFGFSVASGDVNNDSYADVIVGAYLADPSGATNAGQAYVFFGADYPSAVTISYNSTEDANLTFNGTTASDRFGWSVGSGDVNNDNYNDIIVGAEYADPSGAGGAGQAYVFFGADYSSAVTISYNSTEDANLTFNGTTASDRFGYSVASGKVNNDNYNDIIVGAKFEDSGATNAGKIYVFFGADYPDTSTGISYDGGNANMTFEGQTANANFGFSVSSGYINSNNNSEVIVGAPYADPDVGNNAGQVYIYEYDDTSPVVTLDSPVDNGYDTDGDVNFSFTAVEPNSGDKCTLWFRSNVTNWAQNNSVSYSNNIQTNVFVNLTDAIYVWNIECNDTVNNPAFASANLTLTVDTTLPVTPTLTAPSDTSINPRDSISYTCESSDVTAGISKWTWTLTKPPDGGTVTKTGGAVTSNTQAFSGDDTNLAGSYTVKCEAEDKAGHKSSSSSSFSVYYSHHVEAPSEGAGAAADIDLSTAEEVTISEKQGVISTFTLDGTTIHTIKIKTVDEVAGTVTIIIESDPITITLKIREIKEIDVDADGTNDISITLNKITDGIADITTKRLAPLPEKEVPTEEVPPTEKPEEITPTPEVPSKTWLLVLVIVIITVIGVGYMILKKKGYDVIGLEEGKPGKAKRKKK